LFRLICTIIILLLFDIIESPNQLATVEKSPVIKERLLNDIFRIDIMQKEIYKKILFKDTSKYSTKYLTKGNS
jgi:hypothetical protein